MKKKIKKKDHGQWGLNPAHTGPSTCVQYGVQHFDIILTH